MFLKNIFQFLKGYVIISLTGNSVGNFINICIHRKISLWNIKEMDKGCVTLFMYASDFKKLRQIARKTKTKVHIKDKKGLFVFIKIYKKRIFYIAGFLIFILFVSIASRFIWSIEVVGIENKKEILDAAAMSGVKIGAYKATLPPGDEIKNVILTNTDNITWAWVYLKGTKAIIEVREKIKPPEMIKKNEPCDIVAVRDGVITEMTVKRGISFSKVGDVVLAGDLLVGGTNVDSEGNYRLEQAFGEIYARTRHKAKGQIKLFREIRTKTGKKKIFRDIILFSKSIPLYYRVSVPFEEYGITEKKKSLRLGRELDLGIEVTTISYEEETVNKIPLEYDEAVELACFELEKQIAKNLLPKSKLESREASYIKIDEETIEVTLEMEFTEQIGKEIPLT